MNFRNPTWPQVALLLGCMCGVIAAYRLLGDGAAAALAVVTHLIVASSTPRDPPAPPSVSGADAPAPKAPPAALFGVLAAAVLAGACGAFAGVAPDPAAVLHDGAQIGACQALGLAARDAGPDAAWAAYDGCMRAHGYRDAGVP